MLNHYGTSLSGLVRIGLLFGLLLLPSLGFSTVTYVVNQPWSLTGDNFPTNKHTFEGEVTYTINFSSDTTGLVLGNDPALFTVLDDIGNPIAARVLLESLGPTTRRIVLQDIPDEGTYHLDIAANTAWDDDGSALAGVGDIFYVDKTSSVGEITGPFHDEALTIPVEPDEVLLQNVTVYYQLDYSNDALSPFTEVDVFSLLETEGTIWLPLSLVSLNPTSAFYDATFEAMRTGNVIKIRVSNITGPDGFLGITIADAAVSDFAINESLSLSSSSFTIDDPTGPKVSILLPSETSTIDAPLIYFDVLYRHAASISLSVDDIEVHKTGTADADIDVQGSSTDSRAVVFTNFSGEGTISISIKEGTAADRSGDLAAAAGPSAAFAVEIGGPKVIFTSLDPLQSSFGPVTYGVHFDGGIIVSLQETDLDVTTTGNVEYTGVEIVEVDFDGDEVLDTDRVEIVFTGLTGDGTLYFTIAAGVSVDEDLRFSLESDESPAVNVGLIAEGTGLITISKPDPVATVVGPIRYIVTYSGVSAITLTADDLSVEPFGTADATTFNVSGLAFDYTVEISDISGEGALRLVLADDTALDGEGLGLPGIKGDWFPVGIADQDGDLVPDGQEFINDTDKDDALDFLDTDLDLVPDFIETVFELTDHLDGSDFQDADEGLTPDYVEMTLFENYGLLGSTETDEQDDQRDSDGDGLPDYLELKLKFYGGVAGSYDAANTDLPITEGGNDADADGILNGLELYLANLLLLPDALPSHDFDRDGYLDYREVAMGLQPERAQPIKDADDDGIENRVEVVLGDGAGADYDDDADGIPDFLEFVFDRTRLDEKDSVANYISSFFIDSPIVSVITDTDADGVTDYVELSEGYNPLLSDQPVVWLKMLQGGEDNSVCEVAQEGGLVSFKVQLGNFQTNVTSITWLATVLKSLVDTVDNYDVFIFDPADVPTGNYEISFSVARNHNGADVVSSYTHIFSIVDTEALTDLDEDGICDDLDAQQNLVAARNITVTPGSLLVADYGTLVRLGDLAHANRESNIAISYNLLLAYGSLIVSSDIELYDADFGNTVSRNNFTINNLPAAGSSVEILLPYETDDASGIPDLAVYRLLSQSGWRTFDSTTDITKDELSSSSQSCDTAEVFQQGLLIDGLCIKLKISDGGLNDLDGELNGSIKHIGAVALQGVIPVDEPIVACLDGPTEECLEAIEPDVLPEVCIGDPSLAVCSPDLEDEGFGSNKIIAGKAGALSLGSIWFIFLVASFCLRCPRRRL